MIKEAINRILELSTPNKIEYEGTIFTDKQMQRLPSYEDMLANPIKVNTLTSIVDYICKKTDIKALGGINGQRFIIHIKNYDEVILCRELNREKHREELVVAKINNCHFRFGQYMTTEEFIINLQANFVQTENKTQVLNLLGNLADETSIRQEDDGITQKVTAKTGVALVGTAKVPNPVKLAPWRTFTEISQPESEFIFRLKKSSNNDIVGALFEADGEAWKRTVILSIREWFNETLGKEYPLATNRPFIILA